MKKFIFSIVLISLINTIHSQWYQVNFTNSKGQEYRRYVSNVDNSFTVILEESEGKVLLYVGDNYFCEDSVLVYFMFNYEGKFIRKSVTGLLDSNIPHCLVLHNDLLHSDLLEYFTYSDAFRIKIYQNDCTSLNSIFELEHTSYVIKQLKKRSKKWLKENNTG